MPPKNKKDAQQQARKLEEQKKLREQQELRLQIERKKYAGQKISTGLYVPATSQLLIDYPKQSIDLIGTRLKESIMLDHSDFNERNDTQIILKQLYYYLKTVRQFYQLQNYHEQKDNVTVFFKARVLFAIMYTILMNNQEMLGLRQNYDLKDQKQFSKQLILKHSINKGQNKQIFSAEQINKILQLITIQCFSHCELLNKFKQFPKRLSKKQNHIYTSIPTIISNNHDTKFIDLTPPQKQKKIQSDV